jgi:concanavalin A-like lectin/glucanase superfamily protein
MKKTVSILGALMALVFVAPASAKTTLDGWWRFDDTSSAVARDSSGNANNGTVAPAASKVSGYFGSALSFDGNTARVDVPDSPSLEPASTLTVAAWVKGGTQKPFVYIVSKGGQSCDAASYGLYTGPGGGLEFYVSQNQALSYTRSPDAGTGVWDSNWHFIVGTYDGSSVRLYVDGKQIDSGTALSGPIGYGLPDNNDLYFGAYPTCGGLNFVGSIDEPTVWSRVFSPFEVQIDNQLLVSLHRFLGRLPSWPGS